jgi:hypothetical protein
VRIILITIKAEMSIEVKERGPEVAIQCVFLICGVALAYWVDFGFTWMDNQLSWVINNPGCVCIEVSKLSI